MRAFIPIALPFYLFHQTIVVMLGWLWLDWTELPLIKALAIGGLTVVLSVALAWIAAQFAATRVAAGLALCRKPRFPRTVQRVV